MMGNILNQRPGVSRVNWLIGLGLIALLLPGCGGGARSNLDLNTGEPENSGLSTAQLEELEEAFPLLGASGPDGPGWTYHINEGDQLEMVFFSHPDQNRFVTVRPDGRITMPFVGDVLAAGKTPEDLSRELQVAYEEVLVEPRLDVLVQTMGARFYVLGEVNSPGEQEYNRPLDLLQAIALAGGYRSTARLTSIVLLRKSESGDAYAGVFNFRRFLDAESRIASIEIRPDDLIWVPRSAVARWDNAARQSLSGTIQASNLVLDVWQIARFKQVYERGRF